MTEKRGIAALDAEQFSIAAAVGGVRGLIESLGPGLVFVVIFVVTRQLAPALIAAAALSVIAIVARLITGTSVQQAFAGFGGVLIGVIWAWRTGEAADYFVFGLWTNGAYLAGCVLSILIGWPLVGLVVGLLRGQPTAWRADVAARRAFRAATWVWAALFAARLAVQLPLYLGAEVGWLGTARLAMGVPLWAVALWLTWLLVRGQAGLGAAARSEQ